MTTPPPTCTCPSGDGSLRWPCPAHPPATSGQDRAAIRLLVAAGFVTETKANEALAIAYGFAAGPLESVASDQSVEDCGCRQGRGAGGPMIPYTCEKHRVIATSELVKALKRYGRHEPGCATSHDSAFKDRPVCDCGFAAALAAHNTGSNGQ